MLMDENSFGARLAAARRAAGYNQTEVAKHITEAGFPVRTQAVSKWERGTTLPSARQLVELCRLYHIRDVVAAFAVKNNVCANDCAHKNAENCIKLFRK